MCVQCTVDYVRLFSDSKIVRLFCEAFIWRAGHILTTKKYYPAVLCRVEYPYECTLYESVKRGANRRIEKQSVSLSQSHYVSISADLQIIPLSFDARRTSIYASSGGDCRWLFFPSSSCVLDAGVGRRILTGTSATRTFTDTLTSRHRLLTELPFLFLFCVFLSIPLATEFYWLNSATRASSHISQNLQ